MLSYQEFGVDHLRISPIKNGHSKEKSLGSRSAHLFLYGSRDFWQCQEPPQYDLDSYKPIWGPSDFTKHWANSISIYWLLPLGPFLISIVSQRVAKHVELEHVIQSRVKWLVSKLNMFETRFKRWTAIVSSLQRIRQI